jgi:peptide/nickel transport system substrate-binding protein
MKKLIATSLALALATTGFAGLQQAQAATSKSLSYGVITDIKSFEVRSSEFGNRAPFFQAVYDGLALAKPDGSLIPNLALSWKYDKSLKVMTMQLRKGIKFTDGEPFNAQAVVKNLLAFQKGDSPDASNAASIKSVKAKGPLTVVITLSDIDPAFEGYLGRNMGLMQAPNTIGKDESKTNPVGTGMYIFDKANSQIGSVYVFKSNPNYWNKPVRKFDSLTIKVISDNTAAVNALKAGQVDCINMIGLSAVDSVHAAGLKTADFFLDWAGLSLVDKGGRMGTPLKNVKVRQAINYAIDRNVMKQVLGNGYGQISSSVFATYSKGYVKSLDTYYTFNLAKAKQLMKDAGYENGFTLSMPSIAVLPAAGYQAIKDQLAAINITVNYSDVPLNEFFTQILTPKYPAFLMFLERSSNDWTFIKFLINRDAVWNPSGYGDATSDNLLNQIQHSTGAKQAGYLKALNKYLVEQAWFAPFYGNQGMFAYNSKVKVNVQAGNAVPYLPFGITPA